MSWSEEAYAVHKISLDFLKTQKDKFRENLIKMFSVLHHANVIGHNSKHFDCPFAKTWLMRMGIRNLEYGIIQDTMTAYKPLTHTARISLSKLSARMGITDEQVRTLLPIWFPGTQSVHAHEAAYDVVETAILTLRGIEKKLISFESLVHLQKDVSDNDISGMFESDSKEKDPHGFLVKLLDYKANASEAYLYFVNHDNSQFANVIPTDADKDLAVHEHKYLPLLLNQESGNSPYYTILNNGTTYRLKKFNSTIGDEVGDVFSIITEYGALSDSEVDITKIIERNF
jgi:hypothetical protein